MVRIDASTAGSVFGLWRLDFDSTYAAVRWRRKIRAPLARAPGIGFARILSSAGRNYDAGFAGAPDPRRQILVSSWSDLAASDRFDELIADGAGVGRRWRFAGEVYRTTGSHFGRRPLRRSRDAPDGPIAVLTLGRTPGTHLVRFIRHGWRLAPIIRGAPGLITALSAGLPLTGNCTFSVWESEAAMLDFAYGPSARHLRTARARPPILSEQLNARMAPLRMTIGAP
jgi:hypothetical protein